MRHAVATELSMPTEFSAACFALLDDCNATDTDPRSRLYTGYQHQLTCDTPEQLPHLLAQLDKTTLHAVVLMRYELGAALQHLTPRNTTPLVRILLFQQCQRMSAESVTHWLAQHGDDQLAGVANMRADIDADAFDVAIARIQAYITAGDAYQVNFTYRLHFDAYGAPMTLYQRLRARQPVPFGALIALPDGSAILSLSPELFIRHTSGELITQPMKGTAPATGETERDDITAAALAADPKNRAENVMIVDLLRNDLSQVAALATVAVPQLFQVTRFGEVLQMTSTVTATVRDGATLAEMVAALVPCGSDRKSVV